MATKRGTGTRNEVIRCRNCGEDYSVTYKRCPFCDERTSNSANKGGKRTCPRAGGPGGDWGPFRIVATLFSFALILAAFLIVFAYIRPMIQRGAPPDPAPPVITPPPDPAPTPDPVPSPDPTPDPVQTPTPIPTPASATGFSFAVDDVTLDRAGQTWRPTVRFTPAGSTGTLSWSSSNPQVASVSDDGAITALTKGTATVTASLGSHTQTCIVRCHWDGASASQTPDPASAPTLSHQDVTLSRAGERFTLRVNGASGTPFFSSGKPDVASVSDAGAVTAVAAGTATITVSVDGHRLTCIVRCSF